MPLADQRGNRNERRIQAKWNSTAQARAYLGLESIPALPRSDSRLGYVLILFSDQDAPGDFFERQRGILRINGPGGTP
jgi:hypothetical protein